MPLHRSSLVAETVGAATQRWSSVPHGLGGIAVGQHFLDALTLGLGKKTVTGGVTLPTAVKGGARAAGLPVSAADARGDDGVHRRSWRGDAYPTGSSAGFSR